MARFLRQLSERSWNPFLAAIAAAAGFLDVLLLVGWREINPLNLSWLSGDAADYQIGWEFLRHESIWQFPPTWVTRLDYPTGVSASYLDIIPLVGTPLHLLSPFLSANFQYLGLYAVACFGLQAYFGLRLTSLFAKNDRIVTLLGGAFFLLAPVLTKELYGHFALLSQWIVLACIYYYFALSGEKGLRENLGPFVLLAAIAAAIEPYFALMANMIGAAAIVRACGLRQTEARPSHGAPAVPANSPSHSIPAERWKSAVPCAVWGLLLISATVLSLVVFGFIVPGISSFSGGGYTHYSMNLLAPINPQTPWALYFKAFPVVHGWTLAGYDYLGIGVLLLLFAALARAPGLIRKLWSGPILPLTILSILCTLLALSVEVTLANRVLFTMPLPKFALHILEAFRGSGRLFWPAYYLLMLAAIAGILATVPSATVRRLVLAAALVLQYFDVLPVAHGVAAWARAHHPDRLVSADWTALPASYRHLVILPAFQCGQDTPGGLDAWPQFARLAARGGMTLNSVYVGRIASQTLTLDCVTIPGQLVRTGLAPDTAYVLSDRMARAILGHPETAHYCRRVDSFNLCTARPQQSDDAPPSKRRGAASDAPSGAVPHANKERH